MVFGRGGSVGGGDLERGALDTSLDGIKRESRLFNILACTSGEHDVGVESGVPAGKEAALDLRVLGDTSLADTLHSQRILLEGRSEGILSSASVILVETLAASQASSGDGVAERLRLGFSGGGRDEGGLGFRG